MSEIGYAAQGFTAGRKTPSTSSLGSTPWLAHVFGETRKGPHGLSKALSHTYGKNSHVMSHERQI